MPNTVTNDAGLRRITLNGGALDVRAGDLGALLRELGHDGGFLAVALNRKVVPRARWSETPLNAGDVIEIVTPRQGG
jgi:sulfur carrier protein